MIKKFLALLSIFLVAAVLAACQPAAPAPTQTNTAPTQPPAPTNTPAPTATDVPTPTPTIIPAEQGWWNDAIFYEIFVRSFYDSNGDGKGDFNGLVEKLDYLNDGDPTTTNDLGINALWLMPITESPSYHGYDVVDYYAADREYGTKEDFQRLVEEAHKRGIRIIIDLVLNHTSTQHPWFKASRSGEAPYTDYYVWRDEDPGFKGPWGQKVWIKASNNRYYYAVFWDQMPDLNLENPAVTQEIYDITRFWLEEMNVDGFRLDAIRHFIEDGPAQENTPATHTWLQEYFKFYKSVDPHAFTVGEAWTLTPLVIDYVGDEVDIAFEFDLAEAFLDTARGPLAVPLYNQMQIVLDSYPKGQYGVFLTNHDQNRVMSQLDTLERAKLAATLMLTSPGVPFIYYGEEIGMTGIKPDENLRRPMQWDAGSAKVGFTTGLPWYAPATDFITSNVARQSRDNESLLSHYRSLIALRNAHPAMRTGDTMLLDAGSARLFAMLRYNEDEAFLVLVNVHPQEVRMDNYNITMTSGPFTGPLQAELVFGSLEGLKTPEINANGGFASYTPFEVIPPQTGVVIQLSK